MCVCVCSLLYKWQKYCSLADLSKRSYSVVGSGLKVRSHLNVKASSLCKMERCIPLTTACWNVFHPKHTNRRLSHINLRLESIKSRRLALPLRSPWKLISSPNFVLWSEQRGISEKIPFAFQSPYLPDRFSCRFLAYLNKVPPSFVLKFSFLKLAFVMTFRQHQTRNFEELYDFLERKKNSF